MLENFASIVEPFEKAPLACNQPFCPRVNPLARQLGSKNETSLKSQLKMAFGSAGHQVIQNRLSEKFALFGHWHCETCGQSWQYQYKPQHKHSLEYVEVKLPLYSGGRNCKADAIVYSPEENGFVVYEFKFTEKLPVQPSRSHYLQANLTSYVVGQQLSTVVVKFKILYVEFVSMRDAEFVYPIDESLVQFQMYLMQLGHNVDKGICMNPGDWWCPCRDACFGMDKPWLADAEWLEWLKRLQWPAGLL